MLLSTESSQASCWLSIIAVELSLKIGAVQAFESLTAHCWLEMDQLTVSDISETKSYAFCRYCCAEAIGASSQPKYDSGTVSFWHSVDALGTSFNLSSHCICPYLLSLITLPCSSLSAAHLVCSTASRKASRFQTCLKQKASLIHTELQHKRMSLGFSHSA